MGSSLASVKAYARKIYSLDTLDTRFTTPSSTSYQTHQKELENPVVKREYEEKYSKLLPAIPRWHTNEFVVYRIVVFLAVPAIYWIPFSVSQTSDERYSKYSDLLKPGWIPGRQIDVSDSQYQTFRENLPYMVALLLLHPLLRRVWESLKGASAPGLSSVESARERMNIRTAFDAAFAIVFLVVLHGFSIFKVLAILWMNFQVGIIVPRRFVPLATWFFNIGILFANELSDGYHYKWLAGWIVDEAVKDSQLMAFAEWLDSYGGIMSRWEVLFNITVLRLISFNMDRHWSAGQSGSSMIEKKQVDAANLSERDRIKISANHDEYSFRNYLAYIIYAPLYLAGPIMTFNDYLSQCKYKSETIQLDRTIRYGIRFIFVLLAMEFTLHMVWVCAISERQPDWSSYTPAQIALLSFINLHIIWLKLLLPWRLFRLWALADGIDPPENMIRCVSDNYSTLSFWRAWHRSYNRWLIRYLYVPLGGTSFSGGLAIVKSVFNYVLVFTFVALWHDLKMRLLIWGWLVVLFMLPEMIATFLFPRKKWMDRPETYRRICAMGAVLNVIMMIMANLVGFAVGLDGLTSLIKGIFQDSQGLVFLSITCFALYSGVNVMFEIRESEMRKGISMKC
ncbi:Glycerol uptake protein 1 [Ceratocystis lukuohia]|uniref:Glycerol uptake protein 1 n=1 Tax=Ceratocystis lukuohia TaxID=2019550 RepID=A0ABR4MTA1_9PEZI